jgi:hypothetical protein
MKKLILNLLLFAALLHNYTPSSAQNQCTIPTKTETLDINNARVTYNNWGVEWQRVDLGLGGYEIPIGSGANSVFAGRFMLAGIDENDSLRIHVFRHGLQPDEQAIRPGPVTLDNLGNYVMPENCEPYDRIFKISRTEVVIHRLYFQMLAENGGVPPTTPPFENGYEIPADILDWPAHTELIPGQIHFMAPYFENDCCGGTPGIYEPHLGDYPAFKFDDNAEIFNCEQHLLGDQILWWVFNDSQGDSVVPTNPIYEVFNPMGIEVHNLAYAYISNDHLNNSTFLRRNIFNHSPHNYHDSYHGQMIDVDIGGADDDYFGSEVQRGMAYFYNGDMNDEDQGGAIGYGNTPPSIGFNWLGGPLADVNDGIDNNWDGQIDEIGERHRLDFAFKMVNNAPASQTDPHVAIHFYNYMSGKWRDGTPLTYGGSGYYPNNPDPVNAKMTFPGDSDPLWLNTGGIEMTTWSEISEGNPPGDRRAYISSGPFSFNSGDEKVFTMAIVWARDSICLEIPCSLESLFEANDVAQSAYDDCFDLPCSVIPAQMNYYYQGDYLVFYSPITSGIQYIWTTGVGDSLVTDYPFISLPISESGNFNICLTIDYGCGISTICENFNVLNVNEISAEVRLSIYPNPTRNNVNLEITGLSNQRLTAKIHNLQGQLVLSKQIESDRINSISTGNLNAGLYLLQVVAQDGARYTQRFVVVK